MESARLSRFERTSNVAPVELTERDEAIIRQVFEHRFLRSRHVTSLVPGGHQSILRRLQRLYHHGYLDRPRAQIEYYRRGSRPMVYGLGNKGMKLLEETLGIPRRKIDWTAKNRAVTRFHLEHTLAVADGMVAFELACRKHGRELVLGSPDTIAPSKWTVPVQDADRIEQIGVVPDRVFGIRTKTKPAQTLWFFLEVDRATMPVHRNGLRQTSFRRKLVAYRETWRQGLLKDRFPRFRVLTVTTSPERVRNLIAACADLSSGNGLFLFTDKTSLLDHGDPLTHAWHSARSGRTETLL